ncbi:restriction endonuclease PLD domain-containing protein [Ignavigranum ruoffiae]
MYSNNLFNSLFIQNQDALQCNIITGYASPNMIYKILNKTNINQLNVYIGMALEGISIEDHHNFQRLADKYKNRIHIYYKTTYPLNHMKLYEFVLDNKNRKCYAGSANLTQNGFKRNQELLVDFDDNTDLYINEIKMNSMNCLSENIGDYITFYLNEPFKDKELSEVTLDQEKLPQYINRYYKSEQYEFLRRVPNYYQIKIPVLMTDKYQAKTRGINAWVRGQFPYLSEYNTYSFHSYFPLNKKFKIITDFGEELYGFIDGYETDKLHIYPNVYEYLRNRLGIREHRVISYEDIIQVGSNNILVYKENDEMYYFNFFTE